MNTNCTLRDLYAALEARTWNAWATDPETYPGVLTLDVMGRTEDHDWIAQRVGKGKLYQNILDYGRDETLRGFGDRYRASITTMVLAADATAGVYDRFVRAAYKGIGNGEDLGLADSYRAQILHAMMMFHLGLSWDGDERPTSVQIMSYGIADTVWQKTVAALIHDDEMRGKGLIDLPYVTVRNIIVDTILDASAIVQEMDRGVCER